MVVMGRVKIAIATKGHKGLGEEVADHFAKADTFTLATIEGKKVHLEVIKNPAKDLPRGRGRAVVQMLKDKGVQMVVAGDFGMGAMALLRQGDFKIAKVQPGVKVGEIIRAGLYKDLLPEQEMAPER